VKVLHEEKLPLSTLSPWLRVIGEVTGLLQVVRGYVLRYAGGKVLDSNGQLPRAMITLGSEGTDATHIRFGQRFSTKPDYAAL
jgi:Protein of unknown function (DUF3435)